MTSTKEIIKLQQKLQKLKSDHDYAQQNYKDELTKLKKELENERNVTRTLTRTHQHDLKVVKVEEQKKCQSLVEQTRAQLELKFKEDLAKERNRLSGKFKPKKKVSTRISNLFLKKVGEVPTKSKTSHVKELVKRLNGLQTGQSAMGKSSKCVTKPPNEQDSRKPPELSKSSRHDFVVGDADSVTEDPIVPQIVPKQDFENCEIDNRLPEDESSMIEDGVVVQDKNSVINSWTKVVGLETLYTLLSNEHLELQRSHLIIQSNLRKEERTRKHLEEKVKYLNSTILNQKSKQNVILNPINSSLSQQLEQSKERETKLLEQLQELNDQNELLEFRVLELEQCTGVGEHTFSTKRNSSRTPDTDISDSGVISLSPSEDIYCSDSDFQELKLEPPSSVGSDMKERLSLLCQNLENVSERIIVQQAINLLRHYESRITGMEATVSNMCQEVAMSRNMNNNSIEETTSSPDSFRKSTRIIATVLPFSGHPNPNQSEDEDEITGAENLMTIEAPFRKLFRENDSMQESGIYFEEEDLGFHCQSTQTDASNQSRLSEELRKLSQIRQKLEEDQEKEKYFKPIKQEKVRSTCSRQELEYYKEGMERLELRLQLYESCGEEQNQRLKEMLERDEILKRQISRLEEDNLKLRHENELLDMEKCEYEELENDTRLQCQRLEVKLNGITEKKLELQTQLQQNIRLINNLKNNIEENDQRKTESQNKIESLETTISCYEATLNKCEQKNFELEEKEIDLKHRIYLLENIIPILIVFNIYRILGRYKLLNRSIQKDSVEYKEDENNICDNNNVKLIESKYNDCIEPEITNLNSNQLEAIVKETKSIQTQTNGDNKITIENNNQYCEHCNCTYSNNNNNNNEYQDEYSKNVYNKYNNNKSCEKCIKSFKDDKEDLEKIIKDLKLKEKIYEQTMQEADIMFSNMELEYKVQIENFENKINVKEIELKQLKNDLLREREDNDKLTNNNVDMTNIIKTKEAEKKQLNNVLECLKLQLEEEKEESSKFKEEIKNFKKLLETEKLKCKELEIDLKDSNTEIKDIENRVEIQMKQYEKEIEKLCKKLEDHVVTNGELKEEVDTLETVVKELRNALAHERYKRETLKMEMSEELQIKTKEVSELRRNLQGVGLKSTAQEMEEALALLDQQEEDDSCHLSITEIPDKLEKLTEKLAESQEHTQTCELCKSNLSVVVQDLMGQISTMKTSKLCQGPHSENVFKVTSLPRIKLKSSNKPTYPNLSRENSMSNLNKEKNLMIFSLAFELKQLSERNFWNGLATLAENLRKPVTECPDFTRISLLDYLSGKTLVNSKNVDRSPLDLKIIKAVGSNSLLIAWKAPADGSVQEFQVYINGEYLRKIYAEQGRALLHPVKLQTLVKPIEVTLRSSDPKYPTSSAYYL